MLKPDITQEVPIVNNMLVVDLDGTLLKSNMLYESFWSAFGRNWSIAFLSAIALGRGKAALKDYLRRLHNPYFDKNSKIHR
jgi:beta-phosphoglucomutase-like phosphatase (HAD superfamily)